MIIRPYDPEKDREASHRIWREVGWIDDEKKHKEGLDHFTTQGTGLVADWNGSAECLVLTVPGTLHYLEEVLPLSCVTAVATGRLVRKQGIAGKLAAQAIALDAAEGAAVSTLGMFEQGYYDRLGYGTGGPEQFFSFPPAALTVDGKIGIPVRLTEYDWEKVHANRLERMRGHGACDLTPPGITRSEMLWADNGFGLGFEDETGRLTHHFWCGKFEGEFGPMRIDWLAYRNWREFRELMILIKGLGDQVELVKLCVPHGIQFQDLIRQPIRQFRISRKGDFCSDNRAIAYWQTRICDLEACLNKTHLRGEDVRFQLELTDPIERFLEDDAHWRGIGGDYVVTLGGMSEAERGRANDLPIMRATVGSFTRLWLGVNRASNLAVTDELEAPPELLEQLDWLLRLPTPHPDWDY